MTTRYFVVRDHVHVHQPTKKKLLKIPLGSLTFLNDLSEAYFGVPGGLGLLLISPLGIC